MASAMARSIVAVVALWALLALAHGSSPGEEVVARAGNDAVDYMVSSRHILSAESSGVESVSFQRALLSQEEDHYKGYKHLLKKKGDKKKKKYEKKYGEKKDALEELLKEKKKKHPSRRYRKIKSKRFPRGPKVFPPYKAPKAPPPPYKAAPKPSPKSPPPPPYKAAPKPSRKSPPPPYKAAPKPSPKSPPPPSGGVASRKYYYRRSPPPPAKPASTPVPTAPSPSATQKAYLDPHNAARAKKSLPPLTWDTTLEKYALDWSNHQKNTANCALQHSSGPYGENLFWGYGKEWGPADAVAGWVEEEPYYNYASNSCAAGQMCGHYTQVMWKTTTRLGCASVVCNDGSIFFTCSYDPPGNYIGQRPY